MIYSDADNYVYSAARLNRLRVKRPSRFIGRFSQFPNWGFQSNLFG